MHPRMAHILIVDDEPDFSSGMSEFLRLQEHTVVTANTLSAGRTALKKKLPDVLLLDLMLPDGNGLDLFDQFESRRPQKIVIITGHSGIKSLIGGMAGDGVVYMKKPIEPRELVGLIGQDGDSVDVSGEHEGAHFGVLVGDSGPMQSVYKQIKQVAATDSTVLVQGESGTGKELVADAVHRLSKRSGNFIPVNCGGLSKELVSSQLFGHEKGSFTGADKQHKGFFERANNGTLFLDEITEMPLEMQTHLLRVLETGKVLRVGASTELPVNARLVAATNRDPAQAVRDGVLREDLYFRLRVFPIQLPALRARGDDIELLANHFLAQLNSKHGTSKTLPKAALQSLLDHTWPGNVRELKHTVHRMYIMAEGDELAAPEHWDTELKSDIEGLSAGRSIADVEKDLIMATLRELNGDKKAAAASLGVSLKTLYNRLKDYGEDTESKET
ncbi:MAG: sigma-54 dependent transcriptional regulator [Woeseia sp.]|nr:sigma-54 dependent transcriptional regulator [Woeseia sp.]